MSAHGYNKYLYHKKHKKRRQVKDPDGHLVSLPQKSWVIALPTIAYKLKQKENTCVHHQKWPNASGVYYVLCLC